MTLRFAMMLLACLYTHDALAGIAVGPPWTPPPPPTAPAKPPRPR